MCDLEPPEAIAALEAAAVTVVQRTKPAAVLVDPPAVGGWNLLMQQCADGRLGEDELSEVIVGLVPLGDCGVRSVEESTPVAPTGKRDTYLVEVRIIQTDAVYWIPHDNLMRIQS